MNNTDTQNKEINAKPDDKHITNKVNIGMIKNMLPCMAIEYSPNNPDYITFKKVFVL